MSASNSIQSTRRRLSLLTGASFLAALAMAGAGVALVPTAALAADECGPSTGTQVCTGPFPEITYTTTGNLTLQLRGDLVVSTGGLVVVGAGTNSVTINRLGDSAGTGDPSITSTSVSNAALQVTRATAGGNISVVLSDNDADDTPLAISGVFGGVRLANMGTNTTVFTTTNGTITASAGRGIDMSTAGTGAITLTNGSDVTGTTAGAYLRNTGVAAGAITATNNGSLTATAGAGVDLGTTGTGAITFHNNGVVSGATGALSVASGNAVTINNNASTETVARSMTGAVTLNNTGTTTFNNNGTWNAEGASLLGAGASTLNNNASGLIAASDDADIDFGTGADTLANAGTLAAGGTLTLTGLESWNNTGTVLFGANEDLTGSDGAAASRIVASGTLFTGTGSSTLVMDVGFSADQNGCAAVVTADCLDLRDSTTAGSTAIVVSRIGGPLTAAERIVLVDVAGTGSSAADHFALAEESSGYRVVGTTGTLEQGLFYYALDYDATAQQHALTAVAFNGRALELSRIGRAASEPWRTATDTVQNRQAALRGGGQTQDGLGAGVWLTHSTTRISETRREAIDIAALGAVEYDVSFDQKTTALLGGIDLVRLVGPNTALVVGVAAGKLKSELDYSVAASELELDGHALGAYASLSAGALFVDAVVASTSLDLTHSDFGQAFEGSASSFGYRAEAGWRLHPVVGGTVYIEPLAALSYVRTEIDDLVIGPVNTRFAEASSLRGALGLRLAGDLALPGLAARFSAAGRMWKELEAENGAALEAGFGSVTFIDEDTDTLGDLGVAVSLFALDRRLTVDLGYGLKFKESYQSNDVSLGLRFQW